jgi:membrane protein implicated in regulation of membrane protease activity
MSIGESDPRPSRLPTVLFWTAAVVLVITGMALDSRGSFTLSVACFLAASVALVAPLVIRRRREAERTDPTDQ